MSGLSALIAILEDLDDGVCLIDDDGNIRALNSACARSFGCTPEDAIGRDIAEFAEIASGRVRDLGDGTRAVIFPGAAGEVEIEAFVNLLAHDLTAPLRAMKILAEVFEEDYADVIDDNGRGILGHIVEGADTSTQMIDDLLAFTRLGRGGIDPASVGLEDIVAATLEKLSDEIVAAQADVAVDSPLGEAFVDTGIYAQALEHVLRNAITHVAPGTPPRVRIFAERGDGLVSLAVADNGSGIAADQQSSIFGIFARLMVHAGAGGSGIGLPIARKAMRLHGGDVTLSSELGKGSVFRLRVPAKV